MVYTDLLFFLCVLPFSVLISFFDASTEYKNFILILTSLIVFSWGRPFFICLIFLTTVIEWLIALRIEKNKEKRSENSLLLLLDIIINLTVFFVFTGKYFHTKIDAFGFSEALAALGIMYYIIRGFSYVFDVYKNKIKAEKNIFCLLTYMCAYFLMPVGPVVRYGEFEPFIRKRSFSAEGISIGANSFIYGLSKAVIIAPVLKNIGETGLKIDDVTGCWTGAVCILGFAYFLFSGFCDMSWGIAKIYGFNIRKNYRDLGANGLYEGVLKSCSISLFEFFEEIGGSLSEKYKKLKVPLIIVISALTAFMLEQSRLFIFIGITIGIIVAFERIMLKDKINNMPGWLKFVYSYAIGFILLSGFFTGGLRAWGNWFISLFGAGNKPLITDSVKYAILNNCFIVVVAFLMTLSPLKKLLRKKIEAYSEKSIDNYGKVSIIKTIFTAAVFMICIIVTASANVYI